MGIRSVSPAFPLTLAPGSAIVQDRAIRGIVTMINSALMPLADCFSPLMIHHFEEMTQ